MIPGSHSLFEFYYFTKFVNTISNKTIKVFLYYITGTNPNNNFCKVYDIGRLCLMSKNKNFGTDCKHTLKN